MELWIRSQNGYHLKKIENLMVGYPGLMIFMTTSDDENKNKETSIYDGNICLGKYNTEQRALEVLDEIQGKLQNKFLCKPTCILKAKDIDREENLLNFKYANEKFIMQPQAIDIVPINCDIVIYEMPKE